MYSYSGRGWKSTPGSSSSSSSSNCSAGQSPVIAAAAASPDRCCSKSIAEDDDEVDINSEEKDVAAPLPTSNETSAASRHMKTKNTSAKDKRRLREKRRSTGVASLSAGQEADEETTRNTSFNETAAAAAAAAAAASPDVLLEHHKAQNISQSMIASDDAMTTQQSQQPILSHNNGSITQHKSTELTSDHQTSVQSLSIHDDAQVPFSACARTADVTPNTHHVTTTSSNFTKNLCARPFEAKRSILKGGGGRPVTAAKPAAYAIAGGGSVSTSNTSTNHCQSSNEDARMLVRIGELEKLLECERRENGLMKQMLSKKDCRIRDLEINIAALNEDLDLADEDYLRLEEENRALGRALAQLSSTNATD